MAEPFTIRKLWSKLDSDRQGTLEQARLAALLTKPYVLPPKDQKANETLPPNFQSRGARGINNVGSRLTLALYPNGLPFMAFTLDPEVVNSQTIDPQIVQMAQQEMFLYARKLMASLEQQSMRLEMEDHRRQLSFRAHKARTIDQILITGDTLEYMQPNYQMQLYRRDMYVTARDGAGNILFHVIREKIDAASLEPAMFARTGLDQDHRRNPDPTERIVDRYCWVNWDYASRKWLVRHEVNDKIILESEEAVTPYFSTTFELVEGEDYGRGFVESMVMGDLRSLDEMEMRRLDLLALATNWKIVKDRASMVADDSLLSATGSIITGARVDGGVVQDIATLSHGDPRDFALLTAGIQDKRADTGKSMLVESEAVRNAERVTTFEIQRNVTEINSILGGLYIPIADEQHMKMTARLSWQYNRDHGIALPQDLTGRPSVQMKSLTGLSALNDAANAEKLLSGLAILQQLGEPALGMIDMNVMTRLLLREVGIHEPGLIKTDEQLAAEQRAQFVQQIARAGGEQAVKSIGTIAENQTANPRAA
tara:strand:+ start:5640 stop:7256 length:1617 start_codon:yes stop_codon:yes gene_type:complete